MSTNLREQQSRERKPRQPWIIATASVAAASVALVGVLSLTGDPAPSGPPLELSLGEGDALLSCLPFEVGILAGMPMAFEGTATAVDGDRVSLTVDQWYTDGDAEQVTLIGPAGLETLIGGITFETGRQYLITAEGGNVNYCGYSGEATDTMRAAFAEAFGS